MDHYNQRVLFQCTNCEHIWERSHGAATDRRTVVRFNARDRDRFLSFMDAVFERGRNAAKQELRDWLGVKER